MTAMPEIFIDQFGVQQCLGCIPKAPTIKVGASFEDQFEVWDDATIRDVVKAKESAYKFLKSTGFWDVFTKKANQQNTNACNGWLDANAMTLARYLGGITDGVVFSGAYNYSLINGGVDQGSNLSDGYQTSTENGYVPVELCPWNMIYRRQTQQFDAIAAKNKAVDPFPARTLQGFKTGLAKGFMGGCAIQVGSNTERLDANGTAGVTRGPGNHAVCAFDIQLVNDAFQFPTYLDWGPQHGRDGWIGLTEAHFAQTFANHMFWLMPVGQAGG